MLSVVELWWCLQWWRGQVVDHLEEVITRAVHSATCNRDRGWWYCSADHRGRLTPFPQSIFAPLRFLRSICCKLIDVQAHFRRQPLTYRREHIFNITTSNTSNNTDTNSDVNTNTNTLSQPPSATSATQTQVLCLRSNRRYTDASALTWTKTLFRNGSETTLKP